MKFSDQAIIIDIKKYGENSLILKVFSENYGVRKGFIKYANSKKNAQILQIGNSIIFDYYARIEDSLGSFSNLDLIANYCAKFIFDKLRINCFKSIISIIDEHFLEIENFNLLYKSFEVFLQNLGDDNLKNSQIIANYIKIELLILESLGYGINFSHCVVSNSKVNLAYVSPKSAHVVSYEIGKDYANKLLPLPKFLNHEFTTINDDLSEDYLTDKNLIDGLNLSGFFLKKYLFVDSKKDFFSNNFYRENILKMTNGIIS